MNINDLTTHTNLILLESHENARYYDLYFMKIHYKIPKLLMILEPTAI